MADWLIWSNKYGAWWRAEESGFTQFIDEAGRYDEDTARSIVADATADGLLIHMRTDPVTDRVYEAYDEVMVAAPESGGQG